jgi:type III secretion protein U
MSQKGDSGDKTEKPTPKRLKDARKKGNVPKSRDLTSTIGLIGWIVVAALACTLLADRFMGLADAAVAAAGAPSPELMARLGGQAATTVALLIAMIFVPVALIGLLAEFLQAGPVLSFEKIKPTADKLNPVEGFKKMFSLDNLVEVIKALVKTALLIAIAGTVAWLMMGRILGLPQGGPGAMGATLAVMGAIILAATIVVFLLVSFVDVSYQRFSYLKKLKMSRRDIKEEHKQMEGDPLVKQERRQLHQEWGQRNAMQGAQDAMALIVNPTHVAVALDYDPDTEPVPSMLAKGVDDTALAMREAAERAGVPVLRNVPLARELYDRVELYDFIPADMFDAVAEVILWAQEIRQGGDAPPPGDAASREPEERSE